MNEQKNSGQKPSIKTEDNEDINQLVKKAQERQFCFYGTIG